mmetsp:Transcript_6549/g.12721  ORF Transcript_6549/g.12721 Transcript_6549/m.12721 type:complete len:206 (+) Transcript_6549:439-1056(+)
MVGATTAAAAAAAAAATLLIQRFQAQEHVRLRRGLVRTSHCRDLLQRYRLPVLQAEASRLGHIRVHLSPLCLSCALICLFQCLVVIHDHRLRSLESHQVVPSLRLMHAFQGGRREERDEYLDAASFRLLEGGDAAAVSRGERRVNDVVIVEGDAHTGYSSVHCWPSWHLPTVLSQQLPRTRVGADGKHWEPSPLRIYEGLVELML